ncbi:MAG: tetratricopeptide repeat protein [Candidatus Loosdrechtia sp.]|uniref:tetratricopeptide repeat protein n=1 Tax=Candidatus Loosdrechtia sp. TaxID=3101272 RepID=UPI003A73784C|nr:MAG: tetratricopeptide repeat protein [Candidatus Jettenia sp. AMX2]
MRKTLFFPLFFFLAFLPGTGIPVADCGPLKPGMPRDEVRRLFTGANEKYLEAARLVTAKDHLKANEKLHEAALLYETILANGFKHGQLYYNLGNTYYRLGELGKAIVNYRRAQRLMPRNADIGANLNLVKEVREDKELSGKPPVLVQKIFFWFFFLNQNELLITAISFYGMLMTAIILFIILKYDWLKKLTAVLAAGLCLLVLSLGMKIYREQGIDYGVIITKKCHVRYGPGEEYEPKFEIRDGAEFVIEAEKDGWYRVYVYVDVTQGSESERGAEKTVSKEARRGWVQKNEVEVI